VARNLLLEVACSRQGVSTKALLLGWRVAAFFLLLFHQMAYGLELESSRGQGGVVSKLLEHTHKLEGGEELNDGGKYSKSQLPSKLSSLFQVP
jgi:hypothetical protein